MSDYFLNYYITCRSRTIVIDVSSLMQDGTVYVARILRTRRLEENQDTRDRGVHVHESERTLYKRGGFSEVLLQDT